MYRIKTKFVDAIGKEKTITCYTETKWEAKSIIESHYDYIEYTEGIMIEQKVEKGHFIPVKKIYNYKLKKDGGR